MRLQVSLWTLAGQVVKPPTQGNAPKLWAQRISASSGRSRVVTALLRHGLHAPQASVPRYGRLALRLSGCESWPCVSPAPHSPPAPFCDPAPAAQPVPVGSRPGEAGQVEGRRGGGEQGPIDGVGSAVAMVIPIGWLTCIPFDRVLAAADDNQYVVQAAAGVGRAIKLGNTVVMCREHPRRDGRRHPCVVRPTATCKLEMQFAAVGARRHLHGRPV